MATRRARRPYRWLRRGVLLVLLVVVVGVVGLYWFGRQQRQAPPRRSSPLETEAPSARGVTTVGQGFEYTHYDAGRKRFTLRALRTLEDRDETVFLEGVDMLVYEEAGRGYELSADRARYNRERQEALLEGNVRLGSGTEITLRSEGLELSQKGRLLTSTQSAEIVYGGAWRAVGDRFRVHVPEDLFLLSGHVRVDEIPGLAEPFSLRCERLRLERDRQVLRADGGVEIVRPGSRVTARTVNAFLTEDLSAVKFLRARWEVEGTTRFAGRLEPDQMGPPPATRVEFAGRSLSTLMGTDGTAPESSQLEGSPAEPAVIRTTDDTGITRVITAGYLTSELRPDGGQRVEAFGDPEIVEEIALVDGSPATPARRLSGGRGWAEILPDGSLGRAQMLEGAEYRDGALRIRGELGSFDLAAGTGEFFGTESQEAPDEPAGPPPPDVPPRERVSRVTLVHPRGELVAPTVAYTREDDVVHARGGVSTVLRESLPLLGAGSGDGTGGNSVAREATAGAEAAEPTRVESSEAFFRDRPRSTLFRGDVRAWQGESVVLAQWLRADEDEKTVTAGGGVRTVAAPSPTPERPDPQPLTVTAEEMTYVDGGAGGSEASESRAELIYERDVRVEDQGRRIACGRLEVLLGEDGEAERLVATEDVVLEDPQAGKEARARRAVWSPQRRAGEGEVALFGDPAVVTDARGGEVKAPELTYEMTTGRVRAGTSVPEAAGAETTERTESGVGRER